MRRLTARLRCGGRGALRDAGACGTTCQLIDLASWLLAVAALPFVLASDLVTVALYIGFVAWNHERVTTFATLVETLEEASRERDRRSRAGGVR
jgi:hypothetical protein